MVSRTGNIVPKQVHFFHVFYLPFKIDSFEDMFLCQC